MGRHQHCSHTNSATTKQHMDTTDPADNAATGPHNAGRVVANARLPEKQARVLIDAQRHVFERIT
jgi:hypothetical protein